MGEHRGERRGAAVVLRLGEERHLLQLDLLRQLGRRRVAHLRRLRPQGGAAGQQNDRASTKENARGKAGVSDCLADD
jgi:hypothetical protein